MHLSEKKMTWSTILQLVEDYLEESERKTRPVINYENANDLTKKLNLHLHQNPCSEEELITEVKNYLNFSQRTSHPLYNNQLNAGARFEALIAELVTFVTNTTMSTYEVSPVATLMETKLIQELNQLIGFKNGSGIMVTGGSNANLMAIHVARNERFPEIRYSGNSTKKLCVFVSRQAHYSHKKAMLLLGLGLDHLVMVDVDSEGRMDPQDLERQILNTIQEDKIPLMLCSTAGTTVLGSFDPIRKNNEICKKYGLWHHVDGAWGGATIFSKKHHHLIEGLSEADSFAFDAHKLLGTGLITSFFLTKNKGVLDRANGAGGSHYLFHEYENAEHDTGKKSLQCGRKADALKLWLTWKALGHYGIEDFVDEQFNKQQFLVEQIKANPRFRLVHHPEYLNVCFQVLPTDKSIDVNQYNLDLRFKIVKSGKLMVNYSSFPDGTTFFRHVFANQHTTKEDLSSMLEIMLEMPDS